MSKEEALFSDVILGILQSRFGDDAGEKIYQDSPLIGYLIKKTKAANRNSKSRGSFANIYAIYVLVEDYLERGFEESGNYADDEGAQYSKLFDRQRELPFGSKLQNHALNNRLNDEFAKFYPDVPNKPIIRNPETKRYWFNEKLLTSHGHRLGSSVIEIIDAYVKARQSNFIEFIDDCQRIQTLEDSKHEEKREFIRALLSPTTDARLFEIASFAIMKTSYGNQTVWFGWTEDTVEEKTLKLYKTGRTNANDGGIDFVMRPVGRFFQVTETSDVRKYFLDIDKLNRFPLTFVVKSNQGISKIKEAMRAAAEETYTASRVVDKYMDAIEEIVNIPMLCERFEECVESGKLSDLIEEIIFQSQVEFHLTEEEEEMARVIPIPPETEEMLQT